MCTYSSHLGSLKILSKRGLKFCDDQLMQIYNDPQVYLVNLVRFVLVNKCEVLYHLQGDSLLILKKLLSEIASLFPDSHVHIGGEDVKEHGSCTPDCKDNLNFFQIRCCRRYTYIFVYGFIELTITVYILCINS